MRILQIVPSISLVYGGPSQMVLGLSEALAAEGAAVTVLTTNANGDRGDAEPLDVPLDRPVAQDGYEIRYFPCQPFRRYKFSWPLLRWLNDRGRDYDLAHIHALFSPVSTAAAGVCRQQQLPYILRPLGTLDPLDLRKKKQLKQLYGYFLERPNLESAGAVHFTSAEEARISARFGATTRDAIVPLGVQLPEADPSLPSPLPGDRDEPVLLFLSRLDPKKGLELLVPALETLAAEGLPFRFVLAGSNPQDPDYAQRIGDRLRQSPALADRTEIVGFVTGARKRQWLETADLFVLPSFYENFGIAVAEAMAAGTPVAIARGVHIWPEVERAAAGWTFSCEVGALTAALREALGDRAECRRRGENARAFASKTYSWPAIARQTLDLYAGVLAQQPNRLPDPSPPTT